MCPGPEILGSFKSAGNVVKVTFMYKICENRGYTPVPLLASAYALPL